MNTGFLSIPLVSLGQDFRHDFDKDEKKREVVQIPSHPSHMVSNYHLGRGNESNARGMPRGKVGGYRSFYFLQFVISD